jgi:hypothetical protein
VSLRVENRFGEGDQNFTTKEAYRLKLLYITRRFEVFAARVQLAVNRHPAFGER